MSKVLRILALVLVAVFVWVVPQLAAEIGSGSPLQTAMQLLGAIGGALMIPLFIYYAVRGPEAADRLLARFGLRLNDGAAAEESTELAP